ncbi:hypothetical protein M422DRAFT_36217 [Sphaerobolus stellatus SS14]|uniref:Mitochondrial carrier n=1 Tax=Sphaerobolus stellatus (strain SS14) TaxID=990650 RepID=A0A0C9V1X3_SPHS4|nr:hypothetical protein M422DRAFT_36217 [Sphaerobolus stellatus SS14]
MQEQTTGGSHVRFVGILAGMGSGLTKVAVGHSFDTIKTRLQLSPPGTYKGALDCLRQTIKNESILALYKGATPPAVGWAAIDSVLFGSLHNYRLFLKDSPLLSENIPGSDKKRLSIPGHAAAGLCAGLTSAFLAHPIELLKVNLQMQRERAVADRKFKGPIDCIVQVVRTNGVLGLWRGFAGSLAFRSNFAILFGSVEILMRNFDKLRGTSFEMSTGTATFLSGGLASFAYWFAAIPADNVKNRMMGADLNVRGINFRNVAKQIYRTEGARGFYAGLTPCILRAFPVNAAALFVSEGILRLMNAEKTRH